jgi:hypothetical protein
MPYSEFFAYSSHYSHYVAHPWSIPRGSSKRFRSASWAPERLLGSPGNPLRVPRSTSGRLLAHGTPKRDRFAAYVGARGAKSAQ